MHLIDLLTAPSLTTTVSWGRLGFRVPPVNGRATAGGTRPQSLSRAYVSLNSRRALDTTLLRLKTTGEWKEELDARLDEAEGREKEGYS